MKAKASIQGLEPYQPGKSLEEVKRELGLTQVIKLASNENPYGCSSRVFEALETMKNRLHFYPDGSARELKEKLADHLEVDERRLILGNGSDEVIQILCRTFLEPGSESVMADLTFSRYEAGVRIEGATPVKVPLKEGTHDLEAMLAAITDQTRIVWICNPNNPTGTIVSHEALSDFLDRIPEHVLVVLDEAYHEYVTDPSYPDSISLLDYNPQIVILRTFSKIYGLASFRIGYGITHPDLIREMERVREPFNVNGLAQQAAIAALEDQSFITYCRMQNRRGIDQITRKLEELGLEYFPAHGNFVFFDAKIPGEEVFQFLLRKGLIVRTGFGPTNVRITVGKEEENDQLLQALEELIISKRGLASNV
ncbi:histidinol-phosphate transaminase [Thermoflavimicrobium dichotomicum]|uniref:Histidinol-phosphate aminotransferase n=1 Tax=Thermoflavimicrobium dichotomicum TaxID=46223 RepID=A0A1I3SLN1_9BACL|nr:histidinol-phosphate transaminase [Thermoflavimicrobium dichotomicum]SFJ58589.1 histidinol-phosphate aminotransferase [Thermoflavimicrobium dichotomicum]